MRGQVEWVGTARTRLVERNLIGRRWMRDLSPAVMTVYRGVVGERDPETVSKRVYDQVTDAGRRKG